MERRQMFILLVFCIPVVAPVANPTIKVGNVTECPCLSYFAPVDYDCLFWEIYQNRTIDPNCMQIVQGTGVRHSRSVKFQLVDYGNAFSCRAETYKKVQQYQQNDYHVRNMERLSATECLKMKRKFAIFSFEKQFWDLLAANLDAAGQKPLQCTLIIDKMCDKVSTCGHSEASSCGQILRQTLSYSRGTWMWIYANSVSFPGYLAIKSGGIGPDDNHVLMLGSFLIGGLENDQFKISLRCEWRGEKAENPLFPKYEHEFGLLPSPFQNSETSNVVEWKPNLKLTSMRVYHGSSISFTVQWKCPTVWYKVPGVFALLCVFGDRQLSKPDNHNNSLFTMENLTLGPIYRTEIPWKQNQTIVNIQTNFKNIAHPNGSMNAPRFAETLVPIFKYNYFTGRFAKYATNSSGEMNGFINHWTKAVDFKDEYSFFTQAIILPGPYDSPQMLEIPEVNNLEAVCKIRAISADKQTSDWSQNLKIRAGQTVLPVKLLVTFGIMWGRVYIMIQVITEYDSQANKFIILEQQHSAAILPLVDAGPQGIVHIREKCQIHWSEDDCMKWTDYTHIPWYYKRRVGCYHLMFKKWYVFLEHTKTGRYRLASFHGESEQLFWEEVGWRIFQVSARYFPVNIKCPQLYSFLFWSELDDTGGVHVMKVFLDHSSGDPINYIQELDHGDLCSCSGAPTVSIPVLEVIYRNLDEPEAVELAVLCADTICGNLQLTSETPQSASVVYVSPTDSEITWFSLDKNNIFFLLKSNDKYLFMDRLGEASLTGLRMILNTELQNFELDPKIPSFSSVLAPKNEQSLPVPPTQCILPILHKDITFHMISKSDALLTMKSLWNDGAECSLFAKPTVFFTIQYAPVINPSLPRNASLFYCSRDELYNQVRKYMLNCRSTQTTASTNSVARFVLRNLAANKDYFVKVTAMIDAGKGLSDLWFSGAQFSIEKKIVSTMYMWNESSMPMWTLYAGSIGAAVVILMPLVGFVWFCNHRHCMYRYLAQFSHRDIHLEEKFGEGQFGGIWKAKVGRKNKIALIKALRDSATEKEEHVFRKETLLLFKFHSEYVVHTLGVCLEKGPLMLALEFMDGGSLDMYLANPAVRSAVSPEDLFLIGHATLNGCLYLESQGYIHRDISPRNCLLSLVNGSCVKPKTVKLSGFSLAKYIGKKPARNDRNSDDNLPINRTPPEAFYSGNVGYKSDVWGFGVLMWELFSFGATPFGRCSLGNSHCCPMTELNDNEVEYRVCVKKQTLADFPEPCSAMFFPGLRDTCSQCWEFKPDDRPSFKQLQTCLKKAHSEILKLTIPNFTLLSMTTSSSASTKKTPTSTYKGKTEKLSIKSAAAYAKSAEKATVAHPVRAAAFGSKDEDTDVRAPLLQKVSLSYNTVFL